MVVFNNCQNSAVFILPSSDNGRLYLQVPFFFILFPMIVIFYVFSLLHTCLQEGSPWTDSDVSLLIKAIAKYPSGTAKRWEKVSRMVERSVNEVSANVDFIMIKEFTVVAQYNTINNYVFFSPSFCVLISLCRCISLAYFCWIINKSSCIIRNSLYI